MKKRTSIMSKTIMLICIIVTMISCGGQKSEDEVKYFDDPVPYEYGRTKSFEVFQVISEDGDAALATEMMTYNKVVLLLGSSFYDKQMIIVNNPKQVGIYRYKAKNGDLKTVPIIDTELEEE